MFDRIARADVRGYTMSEAHGLLSDLPAPEPERARMGPPLAAPGKISTPVPSVQRLPSWTSPERVVRWVAARYGVTVAVLQGKRRHGVLVQARKVAAYLCRGLLGLSYPEIGRVLHRDHSTVIWAVQSLTTQAENSPAFREVLAGLVRDASAALVTA